MSGSPYPLVWIRLIRHAGGIEALAREWQVHYMTLRRWALGETEPGPHTKILVNAWCRERKLPRPWEDP